MEKVRLVVELPKDLHHQFKVKTTVEGTTMSSVLLKCTKAYLDQPERSTEEKATYQTGAE